MDVWLVLLAVNRVSSTVVVLLVLVDIPSTVLYQPAVTPRAVILPPTIKMEYAMPVRKTVRLA